MCSEKITAKSFLRNLVLLRRKGESFRRLLLGLLRRAIIIYYHFNWSSVRGDNLSVNFKLKVQAPVTLGPQSRCGISMEIKHGGDKLLRNSVTPFLAFLSFLPFLPSLAVLALPHSSCDLLVTRARSLTIQTFSRFATYTPPPRSSS